MLGILVSQIWITIVIRDLLGISDTPEFWLLVYDSVLAVSGAIGLIGIYRLTRAVTNESSERSRTSTTMIMVGAGIAALIGVSIQDAMFRLNSIAESPISFLLLFGLPMACTLHLLYLQSSNRRAERL